MKQTINNIWLLIGVVMLVIGGAIGELARAVRETTGIPWAWSIIIGCGLSFVLVMGMVSLVRFLYSAITSAVTHYAKRHQSVPEFVEHNEDSTVPSEDV